MKTTPKNISICQSDCSGCEACVEMCPELFAWDNQNQQIIIKSNSDYSRQELDEAIKFCPKDCITIEEN